MIIETLKELIKKNDLDTFFYKNKYLNYDDHAIWSLGNMTHNENPFSFKEDTDNLFITLSIFEASTKEILFNESKHKNFQSLTIEDFQFIKNNFELIKTVYKQMIEHDYKNLMEFFKEWENLKEIKNYMSYISNSRVLPFLSDNNFTNIVNMIKENIDETEVKNENYGLLFDLLRGLYANETGENIESKLETTKDAILYTIQNNPDFFNEIRKKATYKKLYRDAFYNIEDIDFVVKVENALNYFPNKNAVLCNKIDENTVKIENNYFFNFYDKFSPKYTKTNFNIVLINEILKKAKDLPNFQKIFEKVITTEVSIDYFTRKELVVATKYPEAVQNVMNGLFEHIWSKEVVDLMKYNYDPNQVKEPHMSKMMFLLEDICREEDLLIQIKNTNKKEIKEAIKRKI